MEHVLPAIKAKRKKRKPPHGRFWWYLGNYVYCATVATYNLFDGLNGGEPAWIAGLLLGCAALLYWLAVTFWWPRFKRELNKWHKDNEE